MTNRIYAIGVLSESHGSHDVLTLLRRACGWDGSGPPPDVVIRPDGTIAYATPVEVQTPSGTVGGLFKIDYAKG